MQRYDGQIHSHQNLYEHERTGYRTSQTQYQHNSTTHPESLPVSYGFQPIDTRSDDQFTSGMEKDDGFNKRASQYMGSTAFDIVDRDKHPAHHDSHVKWDRDSSYLETRQQGDYAASVAGTEATVPRSDDAWVYKEDEYDAKRLKDLQNEGKKDHRRQHQSLAQNGFHTEFFRQPYAKLMIVMTELAIRGQDTDHLREAAPNRVLSQETTAKRHQAAVAICLQRCGRSM
ncbi:hypothetical protein B0T09DRAFT_343609 [Sordaria sp. MPI-SDFR-AT-0083]|nr:hypothetical protein B0T09DRAFT_343609 [Sordaria sp. MPI-SDFR-AT-0083]